MKPLSSLIIPPAIKRMTDVLLEKSPLKEVRRSMLASLRNRHLPMAFQPIMQHSSRKIFGHEALARPMCGETPVPPDIWFSMTHENGLSLEADSVAIRSAMNQSQIASRRQTNQLLFVNVMASTLSSASFKAELLSMFEEGLCAPEQLVLEITEHIAYEPTHLSHSVRELRDLGLSIALDDLGLGASNLASIVELEPDFIKIDKALIAGISKSSSKQRLVSQLVQYMGSGDKVIAEGIENTDDLDSVQQIGVNLTQGYLWGKPQPFTNLAHEFPVFKKHAPQSEQSKPIPSPGHCNGTVEIRDGQILITDPKELGHFPTVEVPVDPRLRITVNGKPLVGRTVLQQSDEITFELLQTEPETEVSFKESLDRMEVRAVREITPGSRNILTDKDASGHLVIEITSKPVYPESIASDTFLSLLREAGYEGLIDYDAVEQLCHTETTLSRKVLIGKPPVPGTPPSYTLLNLPHAADPLRHRKTAITVTTGAKIAIAHPGLPGVPGRDIYGQEIHPPQAPTEVVLGNGVIQIRDVLVARRDGRVLFSDSIIDVIPQLVIGQDVRAKDGRIHFDGDIIIYGAVLDGAQVQASGFISIHGNVLCANVMSERGMLVSGSIVGSRVIGGQAKFFYQSLEPLLKRCVHALRQFHDEYRTVYAHAQKDGQIGANLHMVASLLIERRHSTLLTMFQQLTSSFDDLIHHDVTFSDLVSGLRSKWLVIGRTKIAEPDIIQLYDQFVNLLDRIQRIKSASPAHIRAVSVTSSEVRATGKVTITGPGVFTSTLESDDRILVKGNARGGFLIAKNAVQVCELGTPSGTETSVQVVSPHGTIKANTCHQNVLLQVGDNRLRTYSTAQRVIHRGEKNDSQMRAR